VRCLTIDGKFAACNREPSISDRSDYTGGEKADAGLDHATQQRLIASAKWSATVQVPLAALECRCEGSTATAADTKVAIQIDLNFSFHLQKSLQKG
jgi:hypothetical protein